MKLKNRLFVYGTGAFTMLGALGHSAYAQQAAAGASSAADDQNLETVIVTAERQAMRDSLIVKRNTDEISDNITTAEIGQLPDVTIAEELNRLPGVNMTRDRGNDSQASFRGLGPRLVLGLFNGREVASSEPSQDLRWEIYPSEVLSGAQVYKTQDASLIPGGIAATVDIRTISPLDYTGPSFSIRVGPTYNSEGKDLPDYSPYGYRGSAGYIGHINDSLAVSLVVSAQQEKNAFSDFRTWGWNTPFNSGGNTGDLNGAGTPDNTTYGLNTEVDGVTQDREAVAGAIGWRPSENLTVKLDALWSAYSINEQQYQAWYGNNILGNWDNSDSGTYNAAGNSYQIVNGSVVGATLNGAYPDYESEIAHYTEKHTLLATGLNAEWTSGKWDASADLSYSDAWRNNTWEAIYLSDLYPNNLEFNLLGQPSASTPGYNPALPSLQSVGGYRQNSGSNVGGTGEISGPEVTEDQLTALALNGSYAPDSTVFPALKFGARISERAKTHHENQWGLCPGTGSTTFTTFDDPNSQVCAAGTAGENGNPTISLANDGLGYFYAPGFTAPPLVYGNFNTLFPLVYPNSAMPAGSELLLSHTRVQEDSTEGFIRLDFKTTLAGLPLNGDIGARVAHYSTQSVGFKSIDGGSTYTPVSEGEDNTDFLPSLNATWHLDNDKLLRFGASVAIARPPLDALVTGYTLNPTGTPPTGGGGNPLLKPYRSDDIDLSYEWYFRPESLLAVAVYYKDMLNYIGASQSIQMINGTNYLITDENNTKGGEINGAELTFQTRFFFLPGVLRDFGFYGNYAYAQSNIHEDEPVPNPLPMVGLAKGTMEADLYYDKSGFEARFALKHHTAYTVAPTWVGTTLATESAETTVDASLAYNFASNWSIRLQGQNLTNERARFYNDNNSSDLSNNQGYQTYGAAYLMDVAVRF
ncbi:MAG: TonB-dependent receptor [Steroidobacteraceae bacterium]